MTSSYGFWRNTSSEADLQFKWNLFSGFSNLTRLSVQRCHYIFDDKLFQLLLKEMRALQELELSHCGNLTDAGITGCTNDGAKEDSSFSIADLKGHKHEHEF